MSISVTQSATGDIQPIRVLVEGLDDHDLAGQTLNNLWRAGECAPDELLGRLEGFVPRLDRNALEKLTWGVLCWPDLEEVYLQDEVAGVVVARFTRTTSQAKKRSQAPRIWRDAWIEGGVDCAAAAPAPVLPFPPPHTAGGDPGSLLGRIMWQMPFFDTNAESVARRERLKHRLQRVLGKRATNLVQRAYQRIGEQVRHIRRSAPCILDHSLPVLSGLYRVPVSLRGAPTVLMMVPRLDPGGAEKNIIELATCLSAQGARVVMLTTIAAENSWRVRLRDAPIELFDLPGFLAPCCWYSFFRSIVLTRGITHLHVMNSHWTYEQLPAIANDFPELKVVTQLHAEGEPGTQDFPALAARFDRFVTCHSVISEHLSRYLSRQLGVKADRVRVIRTGIDEEELRTAMAPKTDWRAQNNLPKSRSLVAFVGRFSELKRPEFFLDIAEQVLRRRPDTFFVLKGQGPLEQVVRRRLASNGVLRASVMIEDATAPVAPLMASADLLLLPSRMEGIAYVSYEAMAMGLPQVYTNVGGLSELMGVDAGIPIAHDPQELHAYVDAVTALLEDESRRRLMGAKAREIITAWPTANDTASAYLQLYAEVASS